MLQALVSSVSRWLNEVSRTLFHEQLPAADLLAAGTPPPQRIYRPLERVVLTDQVCRTLFEEFADHRQTPRGEEETGWVLLGIREETQAVVLATLPAGAARQAGVAHVRFNSDAQALASRIVRQQDRNLSILGVVHTHPGSLRHPSNGDFHGDSLWVGQLRGGEGIFGIGTADVTPAAGSTPIARQPQSHLLCLDDMCFSWYILGKGQSQYRRLPLQLTMGPDLARPLHQLWRTIESHAEHLERLCRQQAGVTFRILQEDDGPSLGVQLPLAQPGTSLGLLLREKKVRYIVNQQEDTLVVDPHEQQVDRGVYLVLAELAAQ